MEAQVHEHGPVISRSSFDECLDRLEAERLKQRPNFTFEEEEDYKDQNDGLSFATASWRRILFPDRSPLPQNFGVLDRLRRMVTRFPIRDTSWMVGFSFTIGSEIFVVAGFFLVLPLVAPGTNFVGETPYATSASSVLGGVIFLIGGWASILEGLNLKRGAEVTVTEAMSTVEVIDMTEVHSKSQETRIQTRSNIEASSSTEHLTAPIATSIPNVTTNEITTSQPALLGSSTFIWWPSWHQFSSTYRYDLLFLAGIIQEIGAVVFAIATITSIPGVIDFTNTLLVSLSNLFPAAFGGFLFLVASILQITDAQEKCWEPLIRKLYWHVGLWNAIGSLGFLFAGALPFVGSEEARFQGILAGFWGSWAFLIGSVLQWYCVMGNYP
jgi:hypothetical protein